MITINIEGYDPTAEVIEQIVHRGAYVGQAVKACKGLTEWHYIWTGKEVRKPNELEQYLFRG